MKESAALGFLEPHTISGVYRGQGGWVYTITVRPNMPVNSPHFGERRSMVNGATLHFQECEFVGLCEALSLAESYHVRQLDLIRARLNTYCTEVSTVSTSG